ncbi:TPA: hypothetical protein ACF8KN_004157 [Salmonella enterica]
MQFTKEQLIEQAKVNLIGLKNYATVYPERAESEAMNIRLAEIALASLEAEPVAYMSRQNAKLREQFGTCDEWDVHHQSVNSHLTAVHIPESNDYEIMPLYTAPPAPVVPEECPEEIRDLMASHSDALFNDDDAQEIWNACRAAMLNGGKS